MALSREQFSALRAKGLSTEQIIRFESGNKPQTQTEQPRSLMSKIGDFTGHNLVGQGVQTLGKGLEAYDKFKQPIIGGLESISPLHMLPKDIYEKQIQHTNIATLVNPIGGLLPQQSHSIQDVNRGMQSAGIDELLTAGVLKGIPDMARGYAGRMERKAAELSTKLVPPSEGTISKATEFGKDPLEYGKTISPYIKKSENYNDLVQKSFLPNLKKIGEERNAIVGSVGQVKDQTYFDEALSYLEELKNDNLITPAQHRNLTNRLTQEIDHINSLPPEKRLNPEFLQQRKTKLQAIAKDLYGNSSNSPTKELDKKLANKLQAGYQRIVESIDPRIEGINKEMGALVQGKKSGSKLSEITMTETPTEKIDHPALAAAAAAANKPAYAGLNLFRTIREHLGTPVGRQTASIERMVGRGKLSGKIADLIESLTAPKAPMAVKAEQGLLGNSTPEMAQIEYNPPIEMGMNPDPSKQAIPMDWKATQLRNGRPITTPIPKRAMLPAPEEAPYIEQPFSGGKKDVKGVSKLPSEQKKELMKMLARRKRNFPK